MDNNTVFEDIMQGLHEIEEHQKGNIHLRSNKTTLETDDIGEMYSKLTDSDKYFVRNMILRLLPEKVVPRG